MTDRATFERLYAAHERQILAICLRRTPNPADAEEAAAETFVVAWRRLGDAPPQEHRLAWLYAIARRTLANLRRGGENAMRRLSSTLAALALVAGAAGCAAPSVSPSPSSWAGPSPVATPTAMPDQLEHPTGATDVVLRFSEGGGLMFPEIRANEAPIFTLYGDGRIIVQPPSDIVPPIGAPGPVLSAAPWRTMRLDEAQMRELLRFALIEGGLGIARARYEIRTIMDAPTARFEVNAGGVTKTVEVYALFEEGDAADAAARAGFRTLAARLRALAEDAREEYKPDRYRGSLLQSDVVGPDIKPWPWRDLTPADFVAPADPTGISMPRRVMTQADVDRLGIGDPGGGVTGLYLRAPTGDAFYLFALRPLLPDEEAAP